MKVHVNAAFRALGVHNRVNAATILLSHPQLVDAGTATSRVREFARK